MVDIPTQINALNLLLRNRLAADRPSEFERGISGAIRAVKYATIHLRDALQADQKKVAHPDTVLARESASSPYRGGPRDVRRQSAAAQDVAAEILLGIAAEFLPKSERIQVAIKATQAQRRADGRRAVGKSEIDDRKELIMMARLMIESGGNKGPTIAASEVAPQAKGNSHENTATRLYRKYRKQSQLYDALAAALMRQEAISEARRMLNMRDESQVDAFCRGNEALTGLVEKIKGNAETARAVRLLTGNAKRTRKRQNKSTDTLPDLE